MSEKSDDNLSDQEWMDRFYKKVGQLIFGSPATAVLARIVNPLDMIRDYFDVYEDDGTPEWRAKLFVREFSKLCTGFGKHKREDLLLLRFAERWPSHYGGKITEIERNKT